MAKDYYVILGVSEGATQEEIKRAYRSKARALHPDNHGPGAGPFLEVQEAYDVLGDPGRRGAYDRSHHGRTEVRTGRLVRRGGRRAPVEPLDEREYSPVADVSVTRSFDSFHPTFEDIFERLWGNFTGHPRPKSEHAEGLTAEVLIPAEDAEVGGQVRVMVPAEQCCPTCGGCGGIGVFECVRCDGGGSVTREFPVLAPFPAGMPDGHTVSLSLDHLGVQNLYLTVRFRIV